MPKGMPTEMPARQPTAICYFCFASGRQNQCLEVTYYGMMAWNHFSANEKQNNEKSKVFSVSLSEAIYIILLTFASIVYLVWSQLDVIGSTKLLIYLLPMVFASNFIWLLLRALAYGVFQED